MGTDLLFAFLSTAEHRLAADCPNQFFFVRAIAYEKASSVLTPSRSRYERDCRMEVFASIFHVVWSCMVCTKLK